MWVIKDNTEKVVLVGGNALIAPNLPAGPSVSINDVNFYDYEGTILYSYTKAEFLALTAMPDNPSHQGLTAQGWNWNLEDAKAYVSKYGKLNVGQMYITDDGKTRLYIRIASEGRMDVPLNWNQTVSEGVIVDWGDGSPTQTFEGTGNKSTTHTYSAVGNYIISFEVVSGQLRLGGNANPVIGFNNNYSRVYSNMLVKAEIGDGVININSYTFQSCSSLNSITIPDDVTDIGAVAFQSCSSLNSITIPDDVTNIGGNVFQSCSSLNSITIPKGVTNINITIFSNCSSLASITIPDDVTNIGTNMFQYCSSLTSITIPDSITAIGNNAFNNCYGMKYYYFYPTVPPTLANVNAFTGIPDDAIIYVPAESVDAYKAATNWSEYADHIQPMP